MRPDCFSPVKVTRRPHWAVRLMARCPLTVLSTLAVLASTLT